MNARPPASAPGLPPVPLLPLAASGRGFDAAVRDAGRRRWRTAGASLGAVATAVALLAVTPVHGGTAGLEPARPPVLDMPRGAVTPAPTRTGRPTDARHAATEDAAAKPAAASPSESPAVAPTARPTSSGGTGGYDSVLARTGPTARYSDPPACVLASEGTRYGDWCVTVSATQSSSTKVLFDLDVCAMAAGGGTLAFDDGHEADFALVGTRQVWSSATGRTFPPGGETVSMKYGECVTWSAKWDRVGDDGRVVPAGRYTLRGVLRTAGEPLEDKVTVNLVD